MTAGTKPIRTQLVGFGSHAFVQTFCGKNDARGVGIFLFSAAGEEMRKPARQRHARNVSKRKILQGGEGGFIKSLLRS